MTAIWNSAEIDVDVEISDLIGAHEKVQRWQAEGKKIATVRVPATVDIDEALEEATIDQLRDALGREQAGYTAEQLDAIQDCFCALACADFRTAEALLPRIFEHEAQIRAAETGLRTLHRKAA